MALKSRHPTTKHPPGDKPVGKTSVAFPVTPSDIILTARNLTRDSGSQRVRQFDWNIEGSTVSVSHSVTGREFGTIDLNNAQLLPVREKDRPALQGVYGSIVGDATKAVAKRELGNLMQRPFNNTSRINAILAEHPDLRTKFSDIVTAKA